MPPMEEVLTPIIAFVGGCLVGVILERHRAGKPDRRCPEINEYGYRTFRCVHRVSHRGPHEGRSDSYSSVTYWHTSDTDVDRLVARIERPRVKERKR